MKKIILFLISIILITVLSGCNADNSDNASEFRIVSGSENVTLEPILEKWGKKNHVTVSVTYKGSLEISHIIENGAADYDAVWPANSMWITLGDKNNIIKNANSIMRSPVILAVKKSVAEQLNWTNGTSVYVKDLLANMENNNLRLMMTSASQSNSGASAYFSFLSAFAKTTVLTSEDLKKPEVIEQIKRLLGNINRTAESSGFLKDLFVDNYDQYDAMINYECVAIEANQKLLSEGKEPLYVVYLADGLAIADSPLGYVDHNNAKKQEQFNSLQAYLLSDNVQKEIQSLGRRTGLIGVNITADPKVFNPEWGIDTAKILSPIKFPGAAVIQEALDLYQSAFRKPSFTVFCLDFSGSMSGNGEDQLKAAMKQLLIQSEAKVNLLQATPDDVTAIIIFNDGIMAQWIVRGNDPDDFNALYNNILTYSAGGGTDIYQPVTEAFQIMKNEDIGGRNPSVILMTDGKSNYDTFDEMKSAIQSLNIGYVPVYGITFGDADSKQLTQITSLTDGTVYNGTKDLITAFKKAKGNN